MKQRSGGAAALGDLCEEVVFLGGASVALWITHPAAPAPRSTDDVSVLVEVLTHPDLHRFEERLRSRRFTEERESGVICWWAHLDDAELLGFENRWQAPAIPSAEWHVLPSGRRIRAITPPYLVATKLEAFASRGKGDHMGSHDLEDVVTLVDGRDEIEGELAAAPNDLKDYLRDALSALLAEPRFHDAVYGFLRPDAASQARGDTVVLPRLRAAAGR